VISVGRRARVLLGALALSTQACSLASVDYTGKTCPCGDGYTCNDATGLCEAGQGCIPRVVPTDFRVGWTTPNAIRWRWEGAPAVDDVGGYRLLLATSAELLEAGAELTVFDASRNPELGEPYLVEANGSDPVNATITDELEPETTYHGRLVARDNAGCEHRSPILAARTSFTPDGRIEIFEDELAAGAGLVPDSMTVAPAPSGSPALTYTHHCDEGCYEIVRIQRSIDGADIAAAISEGTFNALAYVELELGTDSTAADASWCEARIVTSTYPNVEALTFRGDGAMHTYQIPLRAFGGEDPVTYVDLTTAGLHEVGVGCTWSEGSRVWLDRISLRW
jgi:hypothetical protein